jgi:hypothetical protein
MITNYRGMYDNSTMPLTHLIPKSASTGDWLTCYNAAKSLIDSVKTKKCVLSHTDYNNCMRFYEKSAMNLGGKYMDDFKMGGYIVIDSI